MPDRPGPSIDSSLVDVVGNDSPQAMLERIAASEMGAKAVSIFRAAIVPGTERFLQIGPIHVLVASSAILAPSVASSERALTSTPRVTTIAAYSNGYDGNEEICIDTFEDERTAVAHLSDKTDDDVESIFSLSVVSVVNPIHEGDVSGIYLNFSTGDFDVMDVDSMIDLHDITKFAYGLRALLGTPSN